MICVTFNVRYALYRMILYLCQLACLFCYAVCAVAMCCIGLTVEGYGAQMRGGAQLLRHQGLLFALCLCHVLLVERESSGWHCGCLTRWHWSPEISCLF